MPQDCTIVRETNLVHLSFGSCLEERYLNVGHNEGAQANPDKRIRYVVNLGNKPISEKTRDTSRHSSVLNDVCDRNVSREHRATVDGGVSDAREVADDTLRDLLSSKDVDKGSKKEPQKRKGSAMSDGCYRAKQQE